MGIYKDNSIKIIHTCTSQKKAEAKNNFTFSRLK